MSAFFHKPTPFPDGKFDISDRLHASARQQCTSVVTGFAQFLFAAARTWRVRSLPTLLRAASSCCPKVARKAVDRNGLSWD